MLARVLLAQNDPGQALALLERLLGAAASSRPAAHRDPGAAGAGAGRPRDTSALGALTEALTLGRPGHVRVLPTRARPYTPCSPSWPLPGRGSSTRLAAPPGDLAALLRSCGQADPVPLRRRAAAPPGLAEPLTDRELEVLRLLAAGRSNQRIARDLVVALDTVKKHVTHVLGKLGAANRTEAAARARQLGLIP